MTPDPHSARSYRLQLLSDNSLTTLTKLFSPHPLFVQVLVRVVPVKLCDDPIKRIKLAES